VDENMEVPCSQLKSMTVLITLFSFGLGIFAGLIAEYLVNSVFVATLQTLTILIIVAAIGIFLSYLTLGLVHIGGSSFYTPVSWFIVGLVSSFCVVLLFSENFEYLLPSVFIASYWFGVGTLYMIGIWSVESLVAQKFAATIASTIFVFLLLIRWFIL
jgi:hypothetical protein